ncbi:MAG: thiamine pyrophosphate-binding protein, partial [Acidobacteria bacterium]|nr:thiamine pyrophosphate-binding protein [Acidobacteriota bacterium]
MRRRKFLTRGALAGAAALVAPAGIADAQSAAQASPASGAATLAPAAVTISAETAAPADVQVLADNERCGSDFMVDVIKSLGFEYICANPGSSFRGLHESIINYGGNKAPEFIT